MLTESMIQKLEAKGFKRWQKGSYDRLYINAKALGLECDYYKTGNVIRAVWKGNVISNSMGKKMLAAKSYINVANGNVYSDNYTLEQEIKRILEEMEQEQ